MIPILYAAGTTSFANNGLGRLSDCLSCIVTEERNGIFEVELRYPITGIHYADISENKIITVSHDEQKDRQPFIIYSRSAEINGIVTFYAHHISYLLSGIVVRPFTATSVSDAFNTFTHSNVNTNPFTFWTDNTTAGSINVDVPSSIRSILGGSRGSVLDVFGGEYEFDNYTVRNYTTRGANNGVTIRYGKNLTNLNQETDSEFLYNAVVAYWSDNDETVVYTGVVSGTGQTATLVTPLDLSNEFEEAPTVAQLTTRAQAYLDNNQPWLPKKNIKIDFVALWQTEEYKDIAPLERVQLCDTVSVYYPELGVNATAKVIKVVWNALTERYDSIELGDARSSFAETILEEASDGMNELLANVPSTSMMNNAINHATELITGGLGGHIVFLYDANGKPTDMLVMDTEDVSTAVHVLRINVNGIGFSSTGVSGTYTSAWLLTSEFNADFITAGHLSANRIQGGTLTLGGNNNGNGVLVVYNASGAEIGRWNNSGLTASGNLTVTNGIATLFSGKQYMLRYDVVAGMAWQNADGVVITSKNSSGTIIGQSTWSAGNMMANTLATTLGYVGRVLAANLNKIGTASSDQPANYDTITERYTGLSYWLSSLGHGTHDTVSRTYEFYMSRTQVYIGGATISDSSANVAYGSADNNFINIRSDGIAIQGGKDSTIKITSSVQQINNKTISFASSSSKRYKHDITDKIDDALDADKLYELPMKQFVFNSDHNVQYADMKGQTIPGFIAEDVAEIYPAAVIHDEEGRVESWDERRIIPGMLKLIQEQKQQIDEQQKQIDELSERLAKLELLIGGLANGN